ncbi:MAG: Holliday junction branch migration protein RuvA [Burkholderiales bacterium]|nr:Holliday junction branch migration protein RuvA [Burkholderiales bacterium]
MIGCLVGDLIAIKPPQILINVAGVGYEVDLPIPDCADINCLLQQSIKIYTHLIIREDAHALYGFLHEDRRDTFRILIKVSGIGPKIAMALLSTLSVDEIQLALEHKDITTLCRTPGIGKKMAERMILELQGKFNYVTFLTGNDDKTKSATNLVNKNLRNDIANALLSLGYGDKDVNKVMQQLPLSITDISLGIKEALKILNN